MRDLNVNKIANYNSQTNAAGNTVVDYINSKREIEVGFIPMNDTAMKALLTAIDVFNVSISFRNPLTNSLDTISCIVPENGVNYYTIQADRVLYNECSIKFVEL